MSTQPDDTTRAEELIRRANSLETINAGIRATARLADEDWHTKVPTYDELAADAQQHLPVTRYCLDCRATREVKTRTCCTCGFSHEACTVCCGDRMRPVTTPAERADGTPRMTAAQRDVLWDRCGRYNVPFREDDYHPAFELPAGWVQGWIGGWPLPDGRKTLFVGVSPEGEVSS